MGNQRPKEHSIKSRLKAVRRLFEKAHEEWIKEGRFVSTLIMEGYTDAEIKGMGHRRRLRT